MKNYFLALGFFCFALSACENDDFCAENTSPKLLIRFYDKEDPETLKEVPLIVWAEGRDTIYPLAVLDSIALPLDTSNKQTTYKFSTTNIVDELKFTYVREDVFISRSCGYIAIFKNVALESQSNNWIESAEISNATIENETAAHVKIYH